MISIVGIITLFLTPAPAATATTPAPAASLTAADAVGKVQQFYANIKQVTALFRQEVTNATFGSSKKSDGKVWLMKPGKMRWDYYEQKKGATEVKKSFISNGTTLYLVEHDNKQVSKKNLEQDLMPVAVTFLYGKGDLKAEFNAEIDAKSSYGDGKSDLVLKLTPKQPSAQYKNLFLVVNKDDFHVKESIIIDSSGNVNHFHFYAPDFQTAVKDSWFEFDPSTVKNYQMIDVDQADKKPAPAGSDAPKK